MSYKLVTAPTQLPITLEEARAQLRLTAYGSPPTHREDEFVMRLMTSQTQYVDGRTGILNRALIAQEWVLTMIGFPSSGPIQIAMPDLITAGNIVYTDPDGASVLLDGNDLVIDSSLSLIYPPDDGWPATKSGTTVAVNFSVGYGEDPEDVPRIIRDAILLRVEAVYDRDPAMQETLLHRADDMLENFKADGVGVG